MKTYAIFFCGLIVASSAAVGFGQVTVTYGPLQDTFVDEAYPANVNGTTENLVLRNMNLSNFELSSLVQFDLSDIPDKAKVLSASLHLYYWHYNSADPVGRPVRAYINTGPWDETTTNWLNAPAYDPAVTASTMILDTYGPVRWDVTGDVQKFVRGTIANYGWRIMDTRDDGANAMIYFRTKEYADAQYRPYLRVVWAMPESTITPTDDAYIDEIQPDVNSGSGGQLIVRNAHLNNYELDSLLKFDLSGFAAGTNIKSATLNLYYFHYNSMNPLGRNLERNYSGSPPPWRYH